MGSCAAVWTKVGRLVLFGKFPLPRPRPPLPGGVVWLPQAPLVRPPPICLSPPSGDQCPLPLLLKLPCGEPLGPPVIPPLPWKTIFRCGSRGSPFSTPVRSVWMMRLLDKSRYLWSGAPDSPLRSPVGGKAGHAFSH